MNSHKNALSTPLGRAHMLKQAAQLGLPVAAAQAGISLRPQLSPRQTGADKRERIVALRRNHRLPYAEIACRIGVAPATVGRICQHAQLAKLPPLQEVPPKCRHERATPGEPLHLDTEKLARFDHPGRRATGDVGKHGRKPGYQALHVAIDDHSRAGFSLMLADETTKSAIAFVFAAPRYYLALGVTVTRIMTDNGSAYRSKKFAKLLRRLKIKHARTRPYTPRTNGKAERFIQTPLREWAYACTYPNSDARARELSYWITHYNFHRPHSATSNLPPAPRLGFGANNVMRNYN